MDELLKQTETRFNKRFAPFIAYRAKSTAVDLSDSSDIAINELEHCEEQINAFIRSAQINAMEKVLEDVSTAVDKFPRHTDKEDDGHEYIDICDLYRRMVHPLRRKLEALK